MNYLPRLVDAQLTRKLGYAGAVCIRGPKWCGKTSTALQQAKSALFMQDPDARSNNLQLAADKPSILLCGERPRLIDEWQDAPQLWDAARFAIDRSDGPGQFIFTGSATPAVRPAHSGTGRFSFLTMRTMSLAESGESTCEVSLTRLFDEEGCEIGGASTADIETLAYLICRGGWPQLAGRRDADALQVARDYVTTISEQDVSRVDDVARSPAYARLLMAEYARCSATMASLNSIRANLGRHGQEMSKPTANSYLAALRNVFAIEDLEPWMPSLRSKARIAHAPGRFFSDPSIAAAALEASPQALVYDTATFGALFESLCVRDLRCYAEALDGKLYRYHDSTGLEADAVMQLYGGRYALFEVKTGHAGVEEGARTLARVASKLDASEMGEPAFLAVIVPGGYAYRREDGVCVIPITCLAS